MTTTKENKSENNKIKNKRKNKRKGNYLFQSILENKRYTLHSS